MLDFIPDIPPKDPDTIFNPEVIPEELEIYFKAEIEFLPPGKKSLAELTPEELRVLQNQYRFSPYRPGIPQTLSGFGSSA